MVHGVSVLAHTSTGSVLSIHPGYIGCAPLITRKSKSAGWVFFLSVVGAMLVL